MYRGNFSIRRVPQVIARSGTALVHFFSDDAYNMSGFNLTYKMNGCPSDSDGMSIPIVHVLKKNHNALLFHFRGGVFWQWQVP